MKKWDIEMTYEIGFSVSDIVAETQEEAIQKARHLVEQGATFIPFDNSVDERDLEFEQVTYIQGKQDLEKESRMKDKIIKMTGKEGRKRYYKYADIMVRATVMGLMKEDENIDRMMDIESADKKFNLKLDEWLESDEFDFAHDFIGIRDNIVRDDFPATDFGFFTPRFAG